MKRRTLLGRLAVAGTVFGAGCTSSGDPEPSSPPTRTDETPTTDPDEQPTVTATDFSVDRRSSGTQVDDATVAFGESTVTVAGTIWGPDGCATAELLDATYDPDATTLTDVVGTTAEAGSEDEMCTQAIVEIEYTAAVTFESELPGTVSVIHDHGDSRTQVTTVAR